MIILLDQSLVGALDDTDGQDEIVLGALRICCQQAREGTHILVSSRQVFDGLLAYDSHMDRATHATLKRASDKLTQRKSLISFVTRFIRVTADIDPNGVKRSSKDSVEEITIPASAIDGCSSLVAKPLFIVENISDGAAYLKIASSVVTSGMFPDLDWLSSVPLRYDIVSGGGHTTAKVFELHKNASERVGVAITDGDYRYPGSAVGLTAAALVAEANKAPISKLLEILVLGLRTIENCLPRATISAFAKSFDVLQSYRAEQVIVLFEGSPFWPVVPIKSGVKCFELEQASLESQFWTALLGQHRCKQTCVSKQSCQTFVLPPISAKLLQHAATKDGPLRVGTSCAQGMHEIWRMLVTLLYSLFCGSERTLTI